MKKLWFFLLIPFISFSQIPSKQHPEVNIFLEAIDNPIIKDRIGTQSFFPDNEYLSSSEISYSLSNLALDENYSFELDREFQSRADQSKLIRKFTQFYKGIPIHGGGYTSGYIIETFPPRNPCLSALFVSPMIYSNIDIDINPTIKSKEVLGLLDVNTVNVNDISLTVLPIDQKDVKYALVYHVLYNKNGARSTFIDAHTGLVLKTFETDMHKSAPTEDHGTKQMNDSNVSGQTVLSRSDGRLSTFDALDQSFANYDANPNIFISDNRLPKCPVNQNAWTDSDADPAIFQTHYFASNAIDLYNQHLSIDYTNVHCIANFSDSNAKIPGNSNPSLTNSKIIIGQNTTGSTIVRWML